LEVKERLGVRFAGIGLLLHPDKTKIAYCKDGKRRREYPVTSFMFCGYEFRPREAFDKRRREGYANFRLRRLRRRSRRWGLVDLFHRVLSERGDPAMQAHRSYLDALGEEEVQATET